MSAPQSLYAALVAAGIPIDHHESDLYAQVTPESRAIVAQYRAAFKAEHGRDTMLSTFVSNADGKLWYDVPFMYQTWWDARAQPKASAPDAE